ncbi:MAG: hypothetical protein RIS62_283 [Chloroflexota bacterium]
MNEGHVVASDWVRPGSGEEERIEARARLGLRAEMDAVRVEGDVPTQQAHPRVSPREEEESDGYGRRRAQCAARRRAHTQYDDVEDHVDRDRAAPLEVDRLLALELRVALTRQRDEMTARWRREVQVGVPAVDRAEIGLQAGGLQPILEERADVREDRTLLRRQRAQGRVAGGRPIVEAEIDEAAYLAVIGLHRRRPPRVHEQAGEVRDAGAVARKVADGRAHQRARPAMRGRRHTRGGGTSK